MSILKIIEPDDWHVHFREGELLKLIVPETSKIYNRAIVMPNLKSPITTIKQVKKYKKEILKNSTNHEFLPLMTFYLTENLNVNELLNAFKNDFIFAAKLYPSGVTTNSSKGVKNIEKVFHILEKMSEYKIPLLIHGEVNDKRVDIFERERVFIETVLLTITKNFPNLKITLEHITSKYAVEFVKNSSFSIKASITPHHLILNRTDLLEHKIKPHYYCLPILKKETDRKTLVDAATSGNSKFFLGTDSAPHQLNDKENECGCAGVFNTINSLQMIAQIFDDEDKLNNLESFVSINGPNHYSIPLNKSKITLKKISQPLNFDKYLENDIFKIRIFNPPFPIYWDILDKEN